MNCLACAFRTAIGSSSARVPMRCEAQVPSRSARTSRSSSILLRLKKRVRRSAGTSEKVLAQELHNKVKAETWRIQKLGQRPRRPWEDAIVRWLQEQSYKASIEADKITFVGSANTFAAAIWTPSPER